MSKIDELIEKLCTNGVEFKDLETCCNILDSKRKPVTKSARQSGEYPYYGANGIQDYVSDYIFDGKFVLIGEDGSVINKNGNPIVSWAEGKIWVNNHAHIIEEIEGVSLRYLYHYIQIINVTSLIHGNIPKLNQGDFRKLQIAVPPLEVQYEIAHILDDFTMLSAELSAELKAREKQYEYYRDRLLTFNNVENKKLKDIILFKNGKGHEKVVEENGEYILITSKAISTNMEQVRRTNANLVPLYKDDITMVMSDLPNGRALAKCFLVEEDNKYTLNQRIGCFQNLRKDIISTKFLYYILNRNKQLLKHDNGVDQTNLRKDDILNINIPIPSIYEQNKIVEILDKFEKICNSISEGLPAEIEARQKQYEYYRDKLLNFKELKVKN